jgi:signal transduction histidine kinase
VGIWSPLLPDNFYLARNEKSVTEVVETDGEPDETLFPIPPAYEERLEEGGELLGRIWFGPRTTAEPFDDQDRKLAGLLAQDLARAIAVRSYIQQLEAIPGVILEAVDGERRRIGQDIHDGVLQFLGGVALSLDRAQRLLESNPAKAEMIIDGIIDQALATTDDTRALVYDLSLPGVRRGRLVEQAYRHTRSVCEAVGVQLDWRARRTERWQQVQGGRAIHVYRILQEALYNAIRHGRPEHIRVILDVVGDEFVMDIIDDGAGMHLAKAEKQNGLGLVAMRERARLLGGQLWVSSSPGKGTTVRLVFPIQP